VTNVRNVTNITNITNITNVNVTNIHYAYRDVGTTAVSGSVFRSGQPVARAVVKVTPQQLAQAQVIAHPSITPARTAAFGGKPPAARPVAKALPVNAARVTAPPAATRAAPSTAPARPAPSTARAPAASAPVERAAPAARYTPPSTPPRFVTKTPPPARDVPFTAHEPAYRQDPGRPLEPQQEENLRQGKPAGPSKDREVLPHASAPKSESKPAPKDTKKH